MTTEEMMDEIVGMPWVEYFRLGTLQRIHGDPDVFARRPWCWLAKTMDGCTYGEVYDQDDAYKRPLAEIHHVLVKQALACVRTLNPDRPMARDSRGDADPRIEP